VIAVETRPVRLGAMQWHQPGDCEGVVVSDRYAGQVRYGVHSMDHGFQPVKAGSWIVLSEKSLHSAVVYSEAEFHHKFKIIEEGKT
jgi:hypothetical protein